jgi:hypothetical protein
MNIYIVYAYIDYDYGDLDIKAFTSKTKANEYLNELRKENTRVLEHNKQVRAKYPLPNPSDETLRDARGRQYEGYLQEKERIENLINSELTVNKYGFHMDYTYDIRIIELDDSDD